MNETQEYDLYLGLNNGLLQEDPGNPNFIGLFDISSNSYLKVTGGSTNIQARLAPGTYWLFGRTSYTQTINEGDTDYIWANMCFTTCATPLIDEQPQDVVASPGSTINVQLTTTSAAMPLAASEVSLAAPWPNPMRGTTRVEFSLEREAPVSLIIYDALGRRVRSLLPLGPLPPGRYGVDWNGTNESGARVAGGVYFVRLDAGARHLVQRAVLIDGAR